MPLQSQGAPSTALERLAFQQRQAAYPCMRLASTPGSWRDCDRCCICLMLSREHHLNTKNDACTEPGQLKKHKHGKSRTLKSTSSRSASGWGLATALHVSPTCPLERNPFGSSENVTDSLSAHQGYIRPITKLQHQGQTASR
jgi:hypothetical protein